MPTYEYQCLKCKKKFERLQKMSDAPLKSCVFCKGKVQRLIGAGVGLIFKGSGFYATDYKKTKDEGRKTKDESAKKGECASNPCASCPQASAAKKKKE